MIVKPYEPEHLDAAARLWLASWRSANVTRAAEPQLEALSARISDEIAGGWTPYLGWRDGMLVGMLALKPATSRLDQLFVLPTAQRTGLGAQLLAFAKGQLVEGMWLRADADNRNTCGFFERRGFRLIESGIHPRLGHPTATYCWP